MYLFCYLSCGLAFICKLNYKFLFLLSAYEHWLLHYYILKLIKELIR